jgi:hypothetical protein
MKKIYIYLSLIILVTSCAKNDYRDEYMGEEMMIDYMFNNFEYGAWVENDYSSWRISSSNS